MSEFTSRPVLLNKKKAWKKYPPYNQTGGSALFIASTDDHTADTSCEIECASGSKHHNHPHGSQIRGINSAGKTRDSQGGEIRACATDVNFEFRLARKNEGKSLLTNGQEAASHVAHTSLWLVHPGLP